MQRELAAEFIGTFTLVSAVCGAALFSAPSAGLMAVAFAVGLSVLAMAFAVGPISGGHFNPAVTCGMVAARRFPTGSRAALHHHAAHWWGAGLFRVLSGPKRCASRW